MNGPSVYASQRSLAGLRALVTGADLAVGRAIAVLFGRHGASMAVHYRAGRDKAEALVAEISKHGGDAFPCCADLSSGADLRRMFRDIMPRLGGLDIVIATPSAGRTPPPVEGGVAERWRETHDAALIGQYLCALAAVRAFRCRRLTPESPRPNGKIIFVGPPHYETLWAERGNHASAVATEMMVKSVAQHVDKYRVRVNCIVPTRGSPSAGPANGRGAKPDDVARAALWLTSTEADSFTGRTWVVGAKAPADPIRDLSYRPDRIVSNGAS